MEEDTVVALPRPGSGVTDDPLLAVLREGARRMLTQAIEAEVEAFLAAHAGFVDQQGRRRLVRNGHAPERRLQTGIGPLEVRRPKLRDRGRVADGGPIRFTSAVLPAYLRRTKNIEELLPWLYLKGVSTGQFAEALTALLGPEAPGLSPATVRRLTEGWQDEHERWQRLGETMAATRSIERERRVDRGVEQAGASGASQNCALPLDSLLLEAIAIGQVVEAQAEPGHGNPVVGREQRLEEADHVRRTALGGHHVGVGVDELASDPNLLQQPMSPERQMARVLVEPDHPRGSGTGQPLEVGEKRRIGGGVVDDVDPALPGALEPLDQLAETGQPVEAVYQDRHVLPRQPRQVMVGNGRAHSSLLGDPRHG